MTGIATVAVSFQHATVFDKRVKSRGTKIMTHRQLPKVLVLLAIAAVCTPASVDGKCVMTQTCVNPDNVPDYDKCIPEAHPEPQEPQAVRCQVADKKVTSLLPFLTFVPFLTFSTTIR